MDRVVAVNELVGLTKKIQKACLIFMVDFEKVYDSIVEFFLNYMLI